MTDREAIIALIEGMIDADDASGEQSVWKYYWTRSGALSDVLAKIKDMPPAPEQQVGKAERLQMAIYHSLDTFNRPGAYLGGKAKLLAVLKDIFGEQQ